LFEKRVESFDPVTDKNGIVIVSDPSFRRQTETRFRKMFDQLPVEIGEVVVAAIDEPVRDLTHAPVAAVFDFYLVNLNNNNNKNPISYLSHNVNLNSNPSYNSKHLFFTPGQHI
jgi:hypothetical protein